MSIPNEFICPISLEIMKDPVICNDGFTYEKKAILNWLRNSNISPMTREPIINIMSNQTLKDMIDKWIIQTESKIDPQPLDIGDNNIEINNTRIIIISDQNDYETINDIQNQNRQRRLNIFKKLACLSCVLMFSIPIIVRLIIGD